jgi:hypothetical protein
VSLRSGYLLADIGMPLQQETPDIDSTIHMPYPRLCYLTVSILVTNSVRFTDIKHMPGLGYEPPFKCTIQYIKQEASAFIGLADLLGENSW